eukprot:scaffold2760_cov167-Amphora_coffeaeformis.AAC.8
MTTTPYSVLLYIPNLIGYSRVVFTLTSYALILWNAEAYWALATGLYLASFVGDLFDGWVARKLNQTSSFGGVLDMITDRCSTLGFLYILAETYRPVDEALFGDGMPAFRALFLALVLLDISCHWCQMYASLSCGQHHKSEEGNKERNFLVRWFYKYYWFFGYLCVGAEFTYVLLFLLQHVPDHLQGPELYEKPEKEKRGKYGTGRARPDAKRMALFGPTIDFTSRLIKVGQGSFKVGRLHMWNDISGGRTFTQGSTHPSHGTNGRLVDQKFQFGSTQTFRDGGNGTQINLTTHT